MPAFEDEDAWMRPPSSIELVELADGWTDLVSDRDGSRIGLLIDRPVVRFDARPRLLPIAGNGCRIERP